MTECIETLVRLKYDIITSDMDTWKYSIQYPPAVLSDWAWRCAEDVEHYIVDGTTPCELLVAAKQYRDGDILIEELRLIRSAARFILTGDCHQGRRAALSSFHAATAKSTPYAAHFAALTGDEPEVKWILYIGWLIEELVRYESK